MNGVLLGTRKHDRTREMIYTPSSHRHTSEFPKPMQYKQQSPENLNASNDQIKRWTSKNSWFDSRKVENLFATVSNLLHTRLIPCTQ
jgi:hypothetical protein